MRNIMIKMQRGIYRATASTKFFVATVCLLLVQSVWMAFTAIYPLPFDEFYHVIFIRTYATQWSPFITQQPAEVSILGDITRTNSYLYHYLMSFPYRVLDTFIDSEMAMVISLRLINIAIVVAALMLFRKLFIMWKIPKRVMHIMFLLFVLTPIVPFVAAHVSYDNLILLLIPATLIFGTRLIVDKGDVTWNGAWYLFFGLSAMLVKETFAPLLVVITLYVAWRLWREHGKEFLRNLQQSFTQNISRFTFLLVLAGVFVVGCLVAGRYGGNYIHYGSLQVKCEQVQPISVCERSGPWYRNRENLRKKPFIEEKYGNPLSFTQHWVSKSMRGFFVPFSHTPTQVVWEFEPYGPIVTKAILPVGFVTGCVALAFGLLALVLRGKDLWQDKPMRFALVVSAGYLVALWVYNYAGYLRMGEAEAIQARYSYPILLLLFLLMIKAANDLISNRRIKAGLLVAVVVIYGWGGGIVPWLIRADDTWRWQNPTVQSVNHAAQSMLKATIIH